MSKGCYRQGAACAALALSAVLLLAAPSLAESWGTITGQVVYGGADVPPNPPANVDKDKAHCLAKGPVLKDELVVNPKNKGVRWALVWLTGVDDPKSLKSIPTNPAMQKRASKVSIDQPFCAFEPRVLGMQEGQTLVIKNTSPIAHNSNINGGPLGPSVNPLIPSKGEFEVEGVKARPMPFMYTCSIHAWMKGYVGVFRHPYFAVTDADGNFTIKDAPAGKYRLMIWHEQGWVIMNPKDPRDRGKIIDIKAGGPTDVGKIVYNPPKD